MSLLHHPGAEQPMPIPNGRPSVQGLVRADLEERERVGVQRYGTPLQAHNGRDALRDAYEEALDLACYLRQAIEEREGHTHCRPGTCDTCGWVSACGQPACPCVTEREGAKP